MVFDSALHARSESFLELVTTNDSRRLPLALRQNFFRHLASDVGQPKVAARVPIRQFGVIEAQQVQNRRVPVMRMHAILDGFVPEFVRRAVAKAALDAAAGHEGGVAFMVVIASVAALSSI